MKFVINPEVVEVVEEESYTINLSKKEAVIIASLLGKVGGDGGCEYKKVVDSLWEQGFRRFYGEEGYSYVFYTPDDKVFSYLKFKV